MGKAVQVNRQDTATYIKELLIELRSMGQAIESDFLVHLLEMAIMEASNSPTDFRLTDHEYYLVKMKSQTQSAKQLESVYT